MEKTQTSLLIALAEKLKKEDSTKELAIKSLTSAGIVKKNGKLTKLFPNLSRVLSAAE